MNMIIKNYGHYRVSDLGRGHYILFNREADTVYDISKRQFDFIVNSGTANHNNPEWRCGLIEEQVNEERIDVA